ncbi:hypothetical protein PHLCEN_2v10669 [Hermanssonia centrifuga]|uniref:Protein BIG1 n=1 Tax=Hermanssonia centrifuga TaxID=98765 RepID=A0A2R6NLV0_9APHY|nr:hypothetical protein PHLCEN_2v10669 [Hermanssonia centrifuga]
MRRSAGNPFVDLAGAISRRCGSRVLSVSAGEVKPHLEEQTEKKHVVCVGMPPLEGTSGDRKYLMSEHESQLSSDMNYIAAAFPKYLVVYAGWASSLESRQFYEDEELSPFDLSFAPETLVSPSKAAATEGGILKRYQLLTPGLIITLLVVFFVLVPLVFMGISALASIQSSVRLDTPKGYNAMEKKTQ